MKGEVRHNLRGDGTRMRIGMRMVGRVMGRTDKVQEEKM